MVFRYRSEIQDIPQIRQDLDELEARWKIPDSEMRQISVIIEELFSNIVRFAFTDEEEHLIEVKLSRGESEIIIHIIDNGIPFNPLEYNPGPVSNPAASNAGGMGLTLVQTFSDSITYHRKNKENHLEITKKIKTNHN